MTHTRALECIARVWSRDQRPCIREALDEAAREVILDCTDNQMRTELLEEYQRRREPQREEVGS